MTLLSTLQLSSNALTAAQIGLQVTGNNIANANSPDYARSRINLSPTETQRYGNLLLGTGVRVDSITQVTDRLLEERLRGANSDVANSDVQQNTYAQVESLLNQLGDKNLSTNISNFFNSIHDVLNQPDSASVRNLAILAGRKLADQIKQLDTKAAETAATINDQVSDVASEVNGYLKRIADLNLQIQETESTDTSKSEAVGLRDQRTGVVNALAKVVDIRTFEQPTGDISVYSNGDFLVFQGSYRAVAERQETVNGTSSSVLRIAESDAPVTIAGGKLAGLVTSRDEIIGGFRGNLDKLTKALISEFNKIYTSGQGLSGFSSLTSQTGTLDTNAPLDHAGLPFTPVNGSFEIKVVNKTTGTTTTNSITVDLNGLDEDTSLKRLADQIDAVSGISARLNADGKLEISADSANTTFAFAKDSSGALAALGINTFFTGKSAADIGVNSDLLANPRFFAASLGGVGADSQTAEKLAGLLNQSLDSLGGQSLAGLYDKFASDVSDGAGKTKAAAEGFKSFANTLHGQYLSVTGVNIDEETVKLIAYQRMFQASARVITTINEMLDILVRL